MIEDFFPALTARQSGQFHLLRQLYSEWNSKINVVSRKDIENLDTHHVLFSLSIARFFSFTGGTRIMDAGTGGGFPGIPLAIFFPEVHFTLVDSIAKKIKVVENIAGELGLSNVTPRCERFEAIREQFHFITGRAVTALPDLVRMLRSKISSEQINSFPNGILYLKGGEVTEELSRINGEHTVYALENYFPDPFFETKKLVHLYNLPGIK